MSGTDRPVAPIPVAEPLRLKDLAAVLVRHYGLTEGMYEPMVEFTIGVGSMGPTPDTVTPSAIVSISRVGLIKVEHETPNSVDAASHSTRKSSRKKSA